MRRALGYGVSGAATQRFSVGTCWASSGWCCRRGEVVTTAAPDRAARRFSARARAHPCARHRARVSGHLSAGWGVVTRPLCHKLYKWGRARTVAVAGESPTLAPEGAAAAARRLTPLRSPRGGGRDARLQDGRSRASTTASSHADVLHSACLTESNEELKVAPGERHLPEDRPRTSSAPPSSPRRRASLPGR